jgi:hypothetical protein
VEQFARENGYTFSGGATPVALAFDFVLRGNGMVIYGTNRQDVDGDNRPDIDFFSIDSYPAEAGIERERLKRQDAEFAAAAQRIFAVAIAETGGGAGSRLLQAYALHLAPGTVDQFYERLWQFAEGNGFRPSDPKLSSVRALPRPQAKAERTYFDIARLDARFEFLFLSETGENLVVALRPIAEYTLSQPRRDDLLQKFEMVLAGVPGATVAECDIFVWGRRMTDRHDLDAPEAVQAAGARCPN